MFLRRPREEEEAEFWEDYDHEKGIWKWSTGSTDPEREDWLTTVPQPPTQDELNKAPGPMPYNHKVDEECLYPWDYYDS